MSRAVFLNMSEKAVRSHCEAEKIGISSIGRTPLGHIRLVCMSVHGAEQIRLKLERQVVQGAGAEERRGPGWGFVARP